MSKKHSYGGNSAYAVAVHELRRSGAAGTHGDRRTKRNRDRAAQKRNAIKDNSY